MAPLRTVYPSLALERGQGGEVERAEGWGRWRTSDVSPSPASSLPAGLSGGVTRCCEQNCASANCEYATRCGRLRSWAR
jgi:hypothetical protein